MSSMKRVVHSLLMERHLDEPAKRPTSESSEEMPSPERVQPLLDERGHRSVRVHEVVWGSRFEVHHRVAEDYRRGSVLPAGDAAHVHSAAGGEAMNTAIPDAVDVGQTAARRRSPHVERGPFWPVGTRHLVGGPGAPDAPADGRGERDESQYQRCAESDEAEDSFDRRRG